MLRLLYFAVDSGMDNAMVEPGNENCLWQDKKWGNLIWVIGDNFEEGVSYLQRT